MKVWIVIHAYGDYIGWFEANVLGVCTTPEAAEKMKLDALATRSTSNQVYGINYCQSFVTIEDKEVDACLETLPTKN